MFEIHLVKITPAKGKPRADIGLKYESPNESETNTTAESVSINELTVAIRELVRLRHLMRSMIHNHTNNCDICLLDALGESDPKKG